MYSVYTVSSFITLKYNKVIMDKSVEEEWKNVCDWEGGKLSWKEICCGDP